MFEFSTYKRQKKRSCDLNVPHVPQNKNGVNGYE